jgi:hypothetical protein
MGGDGALYHALEYPWRSQEELETHGMRNEMRFCAEESSQARSMLRLFVS